jgi:hypothetical protein
MGSENATELRVPSKGSVISNRRPDPLEFDIFLRDWRIHLRKPGPDWDGLRAVAELRGKKMLHFLLCEKKPYRTKSGRMEQQDNWPEWQPHDLLRRLTLEMKIYRHEAEARLVDRDFREVDDFLRGILQRITKRENQTRFKEFRAVFFDLRKRIERARNRLAGFRKWEFAGLLWPELPRVNRITRAIDRDTRLQVELGKMFADYLRQNGVSLETIARLVLLAYLVGKLAAKDKDDIRTIYTDQIITVRKVRDKLRYKGLHKAARFREEES